MDNSTYPSAHSDDATRSKKRKLSPGESNGTEAPEQQPKVLEVAALNRRIVEKLQNIIRENPEVDLQRCFPMTYTRRLKLACGPRTAAKDDKPQPKAADDFRDRLDVSKEATIRYCLSDEVKSLLATYTGDGRSLLESLKQLVWDSPKLWESCIRGVVVKCSDRVVVKYLAEHVPDIPAPRPHGLVELKPFRAIFMSYIPSVTLDKVWPGLSHQAKRSVQAQLDGILCRLRSHTLTDGFPMGGHGGEGVKDWRWGSKPHSEIVRDGKKLEDLQFSGRNLGSKTYAGFLRRFLDDLPPAPVVLTHGDIRQANIMIQLDCDDCTVNGLIDWEECGFYPEYFESFNMTRTLSMVEENHWFLYLPDSVLPSNFPVRWLVDRFWNQMVKPL